MNEFVILALRTINGVSAKEFSDKFHESVYEVFEKQIEKLLDEDLLNIDTDYLRLSKKGIDLANIVWSEFI